MTPFFSKKQLFSFLLGNLILALGICLNAKSDLGVNAIMTIPYGLTEMTGISIGITSFAIYALMVLLQFVMLRSSFPLSQWLQLLASLLSSLLLQLCDSFIPVPQSLLWRVIFLLVGIALTAIGVSLTIVSDLVPGAPDGLANAIGQVLKKDLGAGKNLLDILCVLSALAIGFLTGQGLFGIGIGTLVAVVLTGRIISLVHPTAIRIFGS